MSKVVFVGNIPFKTSEDALIDVFNSVGPVVAFRLVFDRDTGKPKGYGFCEFADHATALSAARNLNNIEVGGRLLRIDLAESDPLLQGKTTKGGEIIESEDGWNGNDSGQSNGEEILSAVPSGKPLLPGQQAVDTIRQFIHERSSVELQEILAQMKAFVFTHPKHALVLLRHHPQIAFAVFTGFAASGVIPPDLLQQLLDTAIARETYAPSPPTAFSSTGPPASAFNAYSLPPPITQPPIPPHSVIFQPTPGPPPPMPVYTNVPLYPQQYSQPPTHLPGQPPPVLVPFPNSGNAEQQHALSILMNLTPAQLAGLSPQERAAIEQLRSGINL